MKFTSEQLGRLARLSDAWVDLRANDRQSWLAAQLQEHPDLAGQLRALAVETNTSQASAGNPLSLPILNGHLSSDEGEWCAGSIIDGYRLHSLLGRGGMGSVWLAEQIDGRLARRVALKLPTQERTDRNWRQRFARERDILAGLDHPGIAKLFDAGVTAQGQPYLAMQYVEGEAISLHAKTHHLDMAARIKLFIELLGIVQHAHASLVVHRDLKPSNIMVNASGSVVLLDFGIAKLLAVEGTIPVGEMTEFAGPAMTLDYASPEQVAGQAIGTGSDIYSLGVVLYELLAGQRPYRLRRASRAAMEEAVLEQELMLPSSRVVASHAASMSLGQAALARQLRGDLDAIMLKALRKRSDQRYPTALAFADDLQRWLRKEPVSAQPDGLGYRIRRFMARRWPLVVAGAAISATLLVATGVALVQANKASQASELARNKVRQSEAVTTFLQNIFLYNSVGQADPEAARKRTAEQLIDESAARIGTALADAPEQQIELLHKMAQTYFEMRLPKRAQALARQAADLAALTFGQDHLKTRTEEIFYMQLLAMDERTADLDALFPSLLKSLPLMASSSIEGERKLALQLCNALMNRDFVIKAESALICAELIEPIVEANSEDATSFGTHHMLAVVYFQNLRLKDAGRHFEIVRRIQAKQGPEAAIGESYPTWQGRLQALIGNYPEAESLMTKGYGIERHNDAGADRVNDWCLASYARFLVESGQAARGLAMVRSGGPLASIAIQAKLSSAWRSTLVEANALAHLGKSEEAITKSYRAQALYEQEGGNDWPPPTDLLEALLAAGKAEKAMQILDQEEPRMAQGRASMAGRRLSEYRTRSLIAAGRLPEARTYLQSKRAILMPVLAGPAEVARVAWLDAMLTLREGRAANARQILTEGLEKLARAGPDSQGYLREWYARLQERLGDATVELNDPEGARIAYEAARLSYAEVVDTNYSMVYARVAWQLAQLARQRHAEASAQDLERQVKEIKQKHGEQRGWGA